MKPDEWSKSPTVLLTRELEAEAIRAFRAWNACPWWRPWKQRLLRERYQATQAVFRLVESVNFQLWLAHGCP